tara:strand:+ start:912 stop:1154 length:243 start_codon:yes stop_codon:yes gene_type:complete
MYIIKCILRKEEEFHVVEDQGLVDLEEKERIVREPVENLTKGKQKEDFLKNIVKKNKRVACTACRRAGVRWSVTGAFTTL